MKKSAMWIVLLIFALVIGFLLGYIVNDHDAQGARKSSIEAVGTYKTNAWNGRNAVMILRDNGTCRYPTGSEATWTQDGHMVSIVLKGNDVHTAEIVDGGLILHGHFFEKVN